MKTIVCIIALLCATDAKIVDPTRVLEQLVSTQKHIAEIVVDDLTLYETQIEHRVEMQINEKSSTLKLQIEDLVNSALERIHEATRKPVAKGVEACYNAAKTQLDVVGVNGNQALETCVTNSMGILAEPMANIENTITYGRQIITDIDSIIPDCYSIIFGKMQTCVMARIVKTRIAVKSLEENAKTVKRTATRFSITALSKGRTCMTTAVSDVRTGVTDIEVKADSCIRNA